jgi:hypothetical protein
MVVALDKMTGNAIWQTQMPDSPGAGAVVAEAGWCWLFLGDCN